MDATTLSRSAGWRRDPSGGYRAVSGDFWEGAQTAPRPFSGRSRLGNAPSNSTTSSTSSCDVFAQPRPKPDLPALAIGPPLLQSTLLTAFWPIRPYMRMVVAGNPFPMDDIFRR